MKKFLVALAAVSLLFSVSMNAQPRGGEDRGDWRERVRSEKKAFLKEELKLEDNDPFWAAYDKAQEEAMELMRARMEAHKALREAIKDGKSEAEIKPLLDSFIAADEACVKQKADAAKSYRSLLSVENQAKLIFAEEKFMHRQMNSRGPQGGPRGGQGGPRGGHRPGGHRPGGHGHGPGFEAAE